MTFVYVSGAGTGGRAMWAQVKKRAGGVATCARSARHRAAIVRSDP